MGKETVISRLNTETLDVDHSIVVNPVATDSTRHAVLDAVTGTIWIANYEGTVTRIDLR
jgi:DNA-binding beta-propeller fold protein YncE